MSMQEAFRKASEGKSGDNEIANKVLREQYRTLGDRYFSYISGKVARSFKTDLLNRRRKITTPLSGQNALLQIINDCWRLHSDFIKKPIKTRVNLLFGLAYGLRISDTRIDPIWIENMSNQTVDELRGYIESNKEFISKPIYSTASIGFMNTLINLYGFREQGEERFKELIGFLDNRFSKTTGKELVTLPIANEGLSVWLGNLKQ
jgi:hypothetical protein